MRKIEVFCTTRFIGFHYWAQAPEKSAYLRTPHRHEFRVRVDVSVGGSDREVEFHELRCFVDLFVAGNLKSTQEKPVSDSCEMMAAKIGDHLLDIGLNIRKVEVWEDGECGGGVRYV